MTYYYLHEKDKSRIYKEKAEARKYQCSITPVCQDETARKKSKLGERNIVRSPTGKYFFSGKACSGNCSGHIAGYDWADDKSSYKPDLYEEDCASNSKSFSEGCLIFIEDYHYYLCRNEINYLPAGYDPFEICSGYFY